MKKLWNMLYAVVFIAIVFFVCRMCKTGCVKVIWYDTDIEEKYRSYWEYSLGDYRFERVVEDDNGAGSGGFSVHKWYKYIFYYADVNGEERCITPSTYCIDDFNEKLLQCVEDVFEEEARLIFMNRTFAEMEGVTAKYNSFYCEAEIIDEKIDLYDSNKGLKFSELNFYNFKQLACFSLYYERSAGLYFFM